MIPILVAIFVAVVVGLLIISTGTPTQDKILEEKHNELLRIALRRSNDKKS